MRSLKRTLHRIVSRLIPAKNEHWRFEWCGRTVISVSVVTFVALLSYSEILLSRNYRYVLCPPFAAFVCVIVKDINVGASIANGWGCLVGALWACLVSSLAAFAIQQVKQKASLSIPFVFILSFSIQYMELHPMGKKLGLSLIPLTLLTLGDENPSIEGIWYFYMSVMFGIACGLVGAYLPWPSLACDEIEYRGKYAAKSIPGLFDDIIHLWHVQSSKYHQAGAVGSSAKSERALSRRDRMLRLQRSMKNVLQPDRIDYSLCTEDISADTNDGAEPSSSEAGAAVDPPAEYGHEEVKLSQCDVRKENVGTKSIHEVLLDAAEKAEDAHVNFGITGMEQQAGMQAGMQTKARMAKKGSIVHSGSGSRKRIPLAPGRGKHLLRVFFRVMQATAGFRNPARGVFGTRWDQQAAQSRLVRAEVVSFLEQSVATMQIRTADARFGPKRMLTVKQKNTRFVTLISEMLNLLIVMDLRVSAMAGDSLHQEIYYAFHNRPKFRHALARVSDSVASAFRVVADWALDEMHNSPLSERECIEDLRQSKENLEIVYDRVRRAVYYEPDEVNASTGCVLMDPTVLMSFNDFMHLVDMACDFLINFWSEKELMQSQKAKQLEASNCVRESSIFKYLSAFVPDSKLLGDLFPSQKHLFDFKSIRKTGKIPQAMKVRFKAAFSMALSMTIAALYGVGTERPQTGLASFTIAYLGGSVIAGATMITAFNRAVGTVIACVIALAVGSAIPDNDWNSLDGKLVRGIVVVLCQLPATYVRSLNVVSYAGTVAGFTVAFLLLVSTYGNEFATDRIIDTFMGVIIYVVVELTLNAKLTEVILIDAMLRQFSIIDGKFEDLMCTLRYLGDTTRSTVDIDAILISKSNSIDQITAAFKSQRDVMVYIAAEPAIFRPPTFPDNYLKEIMQHQRRIVQSIGVVSAATRTSIQISDVDAKVILSAMSSSSMSMNSDARAKTQIFEYLILPLTQDLHKTIQFVEAVSAYIRSTLESLKNPDYESDYTSSLGKRKSTLTSFMISLGHSNRDKYVPIEQQNVREVRELFDDYDDLVMHLQSNQRNGKKTYERNRNESKSTEISRLSSWDGIANLVPFDSAESANDFIISVSELKLANSIIINLKDLVTSMRDLATVLGRMKAHREILLHENGWGTY